MNADKQRAKLVRLMIKAGEVLTRKESQKVLKKAKKIGRKLNEQSE